MFRKFYRITLYAVGTFALTLIFSFIGAGALVNILPGGKIDVTTALTTLFFAFLASLFLNVRLYRCNNHDRTSSDGDTGTC